MSDDNGFVERPIRGVCREGSMASRLIATAENGKAVLVKRSTNYQNYLKSKGYAFRKSIIGAPEGMAFAWCTKLTTAES